MTRDAFRALFDEAIGIALSTAQHRLKRDLPTRICVEFHGAGLSGVLFSIHEAFDALWIDEQHFWQIVDVAVTQVSETTTTVFMRASGHRPAPFEQTWHATAGTGPFKHLAASEIIDTATSITG